MNMIDKIIDSQSITGPSLGQSGPVMISMPDFRARPDSFMNSSSAGFFPDNLFFLNSSLFSRAMNPSSTFNEFNSSFKLPISNANIETDSDKNPEEEDFCEKCQKRFCNKYYLRKHKIDVHKSECDLLNPLEPNNVVNDLQQKSSLFQPSIFNPLFNSSFSNFFLQKSIGPIFPNLLLPTVTMPSISQHNTDFALSSVSNPSPVFSQSCFRISQPGPLISPPEVMSTCSNTFSNNLSALNESRLTNITTSMFDEVKNSFMKLPIDSKSFPSMSSVENNFRDQNKNNPPVTCNICGIQVPGGESVLLDHLFACHNKENVNNQPALPKHLPKKEPTPPVNTSSDSYISPFDAFKSSMAAAKLADRVTCDICHKDLCNKYFLRTHKLKLHGVQTIDSTGRTGNRKEKTGFYDRCSNPIDQLNSNQNFIGTPFNRNLIPDPLIAASLFTNNSKPRTNSPETGCFCPICKRLISLPYFLPIHMWNAHGIGMGSHTSILPSVCASRSNIDSTILEPPFMAGSMQSKVTPTLFPLSFCNNDIDTRSLGSKWYRKSPNQMRVRCDICDKWICNKYFLRTHKLNKHGLTDNGSNTDVNSDSVSRNFFIDSTTVPNTSSTGTDPSDNQINITNQRMENDGSPIDLSASPIRNNQSSQNTVYTSVFNQDKPVSVSSSQNTPSFSINSLWSPRMSFPWPLRLSMDRMNLPSLIHNTSRGSVPLDLSMKSEDVIKPKTENVSIKSEPHVNTYKYRSILLNAAKRLKVKYQKIYRSRYIHNAFLTSRKNCHFISHKSPSVGMLECLSCPLCGKELNDAASFLQHLTQFHDMVLPGNHSNAISNVCSKI